MEVVVGKVRLQPRPRVAVGVDRDEDREHVAPAALEPLEHRPHLVELVGADVGALGEAEIQQHPPPVQVGAAHRLAVGIEERERPAEVGPARRPLPRELPLVLVLVEPVQPGERRRRRAPGDRAAQPLADRGERFHSRFWWRLGAERSCSLAAHVRHCRGRNREARRSAEHFLRRSRCRRRSRRSQARMYCTAQDPNRRTENHGEPASAVLAGPQFARITELSYRYSFT